MSKLALKQIKNPDHEGWMTKQGGSVKNWKRRWFVLKDSTLYYFKSNLPEIELQGQIDLTPQSFVRQEQKHGKKQAFAVATQKRVFFMYADQDEDSAQWMRLISKAIDRNQADAKGVSMASPVDASGALDLPSGTMVNTSSQNMSKLLGLLKSSRGQLPFLADSTSHVKLLDFWMVWFQSLITHKDVQTAGFGSVEYVVELAADMKKVRWRNAGPQLLYIQKMVDFFWNVGAPESEIERLNEVGALMNPMTIGSWIDVSESEGMDGGWYFPSVFPLEAALKATDAGDSTTKLASWAEEHDLKNITMVTRDMGAAPPRQTELRFAIGHDVLGLLDFAVTELHFTPFPPIVATHLKKLTPEQLVTVELTVVTCKESFVKLGVIAPIDSPDAMRRICAAVNVTDMTNLTKFMAVLEVDHAQAVEFQYLNAGFGYGVYKEGFEATFIFQVGKDLATEPEGR